MKKSKSLFEALTALKAVTQTLFKKMPVLFLVVVYLIDLGIRSYLSAGWSTIRVANSHNFYWNLC